MKKIIILICALSTLLCVATGFAQTPPGLSKHGVKNPAGLQNKRPGGWSKGNKCGWYSNGVCVKNKTKVHNYRANVSHPVKVKVKN